MDISAGWHCVGASVRGTSHEQTDKPCQDHCSWRLAKLGDEEVVLIALADGAGSAVRSEDGSRMVVETLLYEVSRYDGPPEQIVAEDAVEWLQKVRASIQEYAVDQNCSVEAFHATALLAILGGTRSVFVQVGDGGWVIEDNDGFHAATWPQTGEYANVTVFVTSANALEQMQFRAIDGPLRAVAGFTDGVQGLCLDLAARQPHVPFFSRVFAPLRDCEDATELNAPLISLLDSALVNDRTDDDKTLLLACRKSVAVTVNKIDKPPPLTDADAAMGG